ncbi:MAG TPA: hypothetical protein VMI54_05565, partial [Polyangiaceae bacterium]|nr:hypothetical protein [Polyangiaceae bacterium]
AQGESPSTALSWSAPAECPDEAAMRAAIESRLGQALEARRDQRLRIEGTLTGDAAAGYTATLKVTSKRGTQKRVLSHADCVKLTDAASLVAALAIDPTLAVRASSPPAASASAPAPVPPPKPAEPAPAPLPPPKPTVAPPPATPRPVAAQRGAPRPWHWSAGAFGRVLGGPLPDAGAGFGARGSVAPGRLGLGGWAAYDLPRLARLRENSGAELALVSFGVGPCYRLRERSPAIDGCVEFAAGDLRGAGHEVESRRVRHALWSAGLLELVLHQRVAAPVEVLGGAEAGDAFTAPRFGIVEDGRTDEVFQARRWVFGAFVGLGVGEP